MTGIMTSIDENQNEWHIIKKIFNLLYVCQLTKRLFEKIKDTCIVYGECYCNKCNKLFLVTKGLY